MFICSRRPDKHLVGYWEFPGGKVESNEDERESLSRELQEELDMKVDIQTYFGVSKYTYESSSIELLAYKCNLI